MTRVLLVLIACLLLAAAAVVLRSDPRPAAQDVGRPSPVRATGPFAVRQGPPPPATGAYLGAAAQKQDFTQSGRIRAVTDLERALGRRLAIVHVYHQWNDPFPNESDRFFADRGQVLLLSWAGTDTRSIAAGQDDDMIRARAEALAALHRPVLLEWRWEMDRPNLQTQVWSPRDYIAAWRHIQDIFDEVGTPEVGWVWCPTADGFANGRAPAYYPGDGRVDWLCADAYPTAGLPSLQGLLHPFLRWAARHPRPVLIGEFGAIEGAPGARARWLAQGAADLARDTQVKGVVYFDIDSVNMGRIFPWSLEDSPSALAAFRRMAASRAFAAQPPG